MSRGQSWLALLPSRCWSSGPTHRTRRYTSELGHALPVLAGLRVVDAATEVAGPYATKLLADAGADVVKVERPSGDPLRRWTAAGAELRPGEDSALFRFLNTSKRSVVGA